MTPPSQDRTRAIGRAKAAIDNGFSRVGRALSSADAVAGWFQAAAGRAISLADAVILLCREHHAAESAPVARAVLQLAVDMRWVAAGPAAERLAAVEAGDAPDWGALWSQGALASRLEQAGFAAAEARDWSDAAARLCAGHLCGGAAALPWHHVYPDGRRRVSIEEALDVTARALREIVRALDSRWPGSFTLEEAAD